MLATYPKTYDQGEAALAGSTWVDLMEPTDSEKAAVEQVFGLRVPAKEELLEIEATSRLRTERGALYMSVPLIATQPDDEWQVVPAGFVLGKNVLMTVRFAPLRAFDTVAGELSGAERIDPALAFVRLAEQLVDRMADRLETAAGDLDRASHVVFRDDVRDKAGPSRRSVRLRRLMVRTGRTSERMARIEYSLVCLDRMAKFAADRGRDCIGAELITRLQTVSSDIASLIQFAEGLVSRVQLLQDAVTGIISIDQNDVMKVLTIASVAGIPPVLIAGIYGMNFKNMPELSWPFGYAFALALIVVSAVVPLLWFKAKDWM